jgi:DNA-binding IclR family transcriptional regulator
MVNNVEECMGQTPKTYIVPAVDQAIRVMLCMAGGENSPKSLTDICQSVGIHRSKAFSILNTLQGYGLVKKYPNRKGYILGTGLLTLTGRMLENLSLPRLVEPILYELAKRAGATVALGIISEDKSFVIAEYEGAPGIGVSSPIGYVTPITYGAHGKVIAAFLSENELADLLKNQKLYFHGNPEKYDKSRLEKELVQCQRDGYALELGDFTPGVNAIAAPLLDQYGKPIGYITVVGFFSEEDTRKLGPLAVEAVKKIARDTDNLISWKKIGASGET